MLVLSAEKQGSLAKVLSEYLGYEIRPGDLRLDSKQVIRIVSVDGVFFKNGEPQPSKWGKEASLPKSFALPVEKEQLKFAGYEVVFDSSFYSKEE